MKKTSMLLLSLAMPLALQAGEVLTPEAYLNSVMNDNQGVRGARLSEKSAMTKTAEGSLIFSPTFFANAQWADDKRETPSVASYGNRTKSQFIEAGISQATRIGLSGKVSYSLTDVTLYNTSVNPMPAYTDTALKFELNQNLWQNGFGSMYRSMEEAAQAGAKATSYGKRYESQMVLFDAEIKYWKLAAIREQIKILKQNLEQTKKVLEFNRKKVARNLADATDLYQSEAQVKARALDLQNALDEEKDASRAFNAARNIDSETVSEELSLPSVEAIVSSLDKCCPPKDILRNDVKAAQEGLKAAQANSLISQEKIRPDLSLFASGSFNNKDIKTKNSISELDSEHPYLAVGVKFSLPLDIFTRNSLHDAYAGESFGAELTYKKRLFDQDAEWKSLNKKIDLISKRLVLSKELKEAQAIKLEKERERQQNGKSTTFQVFQFELEYLGSQLSLVQMQANALMLMAQEKTFHDTL